MREIGVSIVIPAYNERENLEPTLTRLTESVRTPSEVLIVVDTEQDTTIGAFDELAARFPQARVLVQNLGRGPANAIRYGFMSAQAPVVVVTMADGSDDVAVIDTLVQLVGRGCAVAAASRYMPGGAQIGGSRAKKFMSRGAGRSLHAFAGVGTRDATNSFKAYSTNFVRDVGIDSRDGFELGIELVAKANRLGLPVAEVPTIWLDRANGQSNFRLREWLPKYLRWYRFAYGPRLSLDDMHRRLHHTREGVE